MRKLPDTNEAFRNRPIKGKITEKLPHESAEHHVSGQALYIDDLPEPKGLLFVAVGGSKHSHAKIKAIDLLAVKQSAGVVATLTADEVPGAIDIGPVFAGDLVLAQDKTEFIGQPIFAVAADSAEQAQQAVQKAQIEYEPQEVIADIPEAIKQQSFVRPEHTQAIGDVEHAINQAPHQCHGQVHIKGQEHFYLEGQIACVIPQENGFKVYSSTQHPSEVQKLVAQVLNLPLHAIHVEVRRLGGGFGGKETQAASIACIAALLAHKTKRPVKYRVCRKDDMVMTGKRHDFIGQYTVGFDAQGIIRGADIEVSARCGNSPDLSDAIVDRAMFHVDNAYTLKQARVKGIRCKTHTVSGTAFRGFGGPQGMVVAESIIDEIARACQLDPLVVRKNNLYNETHNETHYGQKITDHSLREIIQQLEESGSYWPRREKIKAFNNNSQILKKGLALTPVKFGISFTAQFLNQAGALVHIYTDGSIQVNHGGTEMGQGLHTKIAQIAANVFQVDIDHIKVCATSTEKVPNTSPTAASAGTDLNGKATENACVIIKKRLVEFLTSKYDATDKEVQFTNNHVLIKDIELSFANVIQQAYMARISLSSTGFYQTPEVFYDREKGKGQPFYYYANGAALSEVIIDTLTGEYAVLQTDILHDVGVSLNPAIDMGQIEGGFIQGMGWVTTEDLTWSETGKLLSNSPANYKIPTAGDIPEKFNVMLYQKPNEKNTIYKSKAVGEPPLMLALSVWAALRDAVASTCGYKMNPSFNLPATPEEVLRALTEIHNRTSLTRQGNQA